MIKTGPVTCQHVAVIVGLFQATLLTENLSKYTVNLVKRLQVTRWTVIWKDIEIVYF